VELRTYRRKAKTVAAWHYPTTAAIGVFLLAPTVVVVIMSFSSGNLLTFPPPSWGFRWYRVFMGSALWTNALKFSVILGAATAVLATILGTALALGLARTRGRLARLVSALVISPMIVPILVTAIGVYFASTHLSLSTFNSLLLVHTALGLPFIVLVVLSSLKILDPDLGRAASGLGAGPWAAFRYITLPLIAPSILIGAVFAFQFSWDEVVVANFLSTPGHQTLPVVMWIEARQTVEPTLAAASTLLSAVTLAFLFIFLYLQRYNLRRIGSAREGQARG
jgi:putative spermidine/putrescine transport system permease protein